MLIFIRVELHILMLDFRFDLGVLVSPWVDALGGLGLVSELLFGGFYASSVELFGFC